MNWFSNASPKLNQRPRDAALTPRPNPLGLQNSSDGIALIALNLDHAFFALQAISPPGSTLVFEFLGPFFKGEISTLGKPSKTVTALLPSPGLLQS